MEFDAINRRLKNLEKIMSELKIDIANEKKLIDGKKSNSPKIKIQNPTKLDRHHNVQDDKESYIRFRDENADVGFFDRVKTLLDKMPESNGSKFYPKIQYKIGIIADEFLFNSFEGMADFVYITRKNYKEHLGKLDIFLVASAWKGLNQEWKGLANPKSVKVREELFAIIEEFRSKGTKTVFYSKEDPVNYDRFIDIAKKCDYIFTTAEEMVETYQAACSNDKVYVLPFGINPVYHNPIGMKKFKKQDGVLFAGSWYSKYPQRQKETRMLFDGIRESGHGLKVIDRNYELNNEQYFFPKEYIPFLSPSVHHAYLQKLHKLYDWSINLNSVKYSPTMFANRVYELQALGNILISNYSIAINNKFPNVFLVHKKNEVGDILDGFTEEEKYKHQAYGIRKVMSNETTYQRVESLIQSIGMNYKPLERTVAVIIERSSKRLQEQFEAQSYPYKELILEADFTEEIKEKFDMVAFFDENKDYSEFYLEDMVNGFKYTNSDYITKDAYYSGNQLIAGIEHDYVTEMKDKARTVFWATSYSASDLKGFYGVKKLPNGYSVDHFEFNEKIVEEASPVKRDYKLSVVIPAYNNGDFLLNKCFNSLKRSTMFNDMEIIIVDDGSTDEFTPAIIRRIAREHENVSAFYYNDGGSGSASRPRNKGFELSTAPYVTYLDPDNEAVNDGYHKLYQEIHKNNYDLVVGNIFRVSDKEIRINYTRAAYTANGNKELIDDNSRQVLVKSKFKAASIQALIVKREIIETNTLKMVVGAAGQDTMFFHELMLCAKKVKLKEIDVHIYYAAVSGSTVNSITKRFFEKYYALEKYRVVAFKEKGILKDYLEQRFEYYFKNWYLEKLKKVKPEDALESIKIISDIYEFYRKEVNVSDPDLIQFAKLSKKKDYQAIRDIYS